MQGMPEGWYQDPAPPNPHQPTTVRLWDGTQWTTQVKPASRQQRAAWRDDLVVARRVAVLQQAPAPPGYGAVAPGSRDLTDDGQRLAGWGSRWGASIVDAIISQMAGVAFGWPFLRRLGEVFASTVTVDGSTTATGVYPEPTAGEVLVPFLGLLAVFLAVGFVYEVGFLKAFQATPGKFLFGLEVRLLELPGTLSWGTVLGRWGMKYLGSLVGLVPLVGLVGTVYWLVDRLWPLWDPRRQALHDKVARTCVVRTRS